MKLTRREDLDTTTRINLAIMALYCQGVYSARTALAYEYNISRSFLYQLIGAAMFCLQELFSPERAIASLAQLDLNSAIVLLRLEGKVSIGNISEILQLQGHEHTSTGMISDRLKFFGQRLPCTLRAEFPRHIYCSSDEIFAINSPILISIDPDRHAILRIELSPDRKAETWQEHFEALHEQQFIPIGLNSDRGTGLIQGYQAAFQNAVWTSDHFHEFRGLTKLCSILEKQAYAAIGVEEERLRVFNNARSEDTLPNRLQQLNNATIDCDQKITQYQHVSDTLDILFGSIYFFDLDPYKPSYPQQVKSDVLTLMDLLDEVNLPKLQVETHKIRAHIDDICLSSQQVESICQELSKIITSEQLEYIGRAKQHDHQSHQHKGKAKKYHQAERDYWLEFVPPLLGKNAQTLIKQAFEQFEGMVRSSSLIEMVNSQVRPYLNSCKGQITQEYLNLIMFYHNHLIVKSGKRKGKAPIEILTGKKLEKNWLELLFDTVYQTQ